MSDNCKSSLKKRRVIDCDDLNHVRQLWEHEDHLINQRMTWLGVTQTLLFAAYGLLLTQSNVQDGMSKDKLHELSELLPIVGVLTSSVILIGIIAAFLAMCELKKKCNLECLGITDNTTYMGLTCGLGLPVIFVAAWVKLLL
ncbi:MAG: hypothetical protein AAF434_01550 [Pseudomonadota bacterium]